MMRIFPPGFNQRILSLALSVSKTLAACEPCSEKWPQLSQCMSMTTLGLMSLIRRIACVLSIVICSGGSDTVVLDWRGLFDVHHVTREVFPFIWPKSGLYKTNLIYYPPGKC